MGQLCVLFDEAKLEVTPAMQHKETCACTLCSQLAVKMTSQRGIPKNTPAFQEGSRVKLRSVPLRKVCTKLW